MERSFDYREFRLAGVRRALEGAVYRGHTTGQAEGTVFEPSLRRNPRLQQVTWRHACRGRRCHKTAGWREAPFFSERERAALRWAEIVTATPHSDASDEEFAALRAHFSDEEIAELGFAIVTINAWNLLNVSFRNPIPEKA